jgi:hypothetical protein
MMPLSSMRPYLAVISDSFRAALASRILWIAFIAVWLFLGGLAPIGYHEDYTTTFRWFDLDNGTQMKAMLARGLVDPQQKDTALGRIARTFPGDVRRKLRQVAEGEDVRIDKSALADSLNEAMDDESWYDREAWQATVRLRELRELDQLSDEEISEPQRRRRARLRIEAALPGVFAAQGARSITLSYAGFDFPAEFAIGKEQFISLVNQFVVPVIMNWLLGFALIFLGILVTASIIPDMLQPGSLHLLLSKPISRTLLLVSKFIGGCAFVFLCVSQLVIGLWLIAGWRLDLWNARILWCIPVCVFLFAVYFSVSVLAGLRWRSPILSIGVTCMFGAFVLVIGFVGGYFDGLVQGPDRISHLSFDGDSIIASTRGAGLKRYDSAANAWKDVLDSDFRRRDLVVPPVRLGEDRIATAKIRNGRFNLYGSGSLDLLVLDGEQDWKARPGLRLPNGTRRMFVVGDQLITLNNVGLMATTVRQAIEGAIEATDDEIDDDTETESSETESSPAESSPAESSPAESTAASERSFESIGMTGWISDLLRMQGGATESFRSIMPAGLTLTDPVRIAVLKQQNALMVYSRGRLLRLEFADAAPDASDDRASEAKLTGASTATSVESLEITADVLLDGDASGAILLAVSGDSVLLSRDEEQVEWYDATTLKLLARYSLPADLAPVSLVGLGRRDGFAVLTADATCHLARRVDDSLKLVPLSISDVTAIEYNDRSEQLVVAHHIDSVEFVNIGDSLETTETVRQIRPSLSGWRSVDRWVITPLRTVTPQTGELSDTVAALVSGKRSLALGPEQSEDREVVPLRIARPVLSCGVFLLVVMAISCVYFARADF